MKPDEDGDVDEDVLAEVLEQARNGKRVPGYRLIIFDADGTLVDRDNGVWLPGRKEWFEGKVGGDQKFAIASNQGGVGLRFWMQRDGFGEPDKYPEEEDIRSRYVHFYGPTIGAKVYLCYAYQSKSSGEWGPRPLGTIGKPEWNPKNRKPAPGMLLQAMSDAGVEPHETLMVGDSIEDEQAAQAAGCDFMWAKYFFHTTDAADDASRKVGE